MLKYIGSAFNDEQYAILFKAAQDELKILKRSTQNPSTRAPTRDSCDGVCLYEVSGESRVTEGLHDICGMILDRLELDTCLTSYRHRQLKDVIIARIAQPASKLQTAHILGRDFRTPMTENQIYRLMDEGECPESS